jgi:hypothetical protein
MPLDDNIDAVAKALHDIDCGCHAYGETPDEDEALHYYSLAQAAYTALTTSLLTRSHSNQPRTPNKL